MPTTTAVPWRIYLLIDTSTKPTNHALGTIFYVGSRADLSNPVDLREATQWQSLPKDEAPARERLERLNREGVRVLVEVIPEQDWPRSQGTELARTIGTLCATLHPAPLNERLKSVRWTGTLAQTVESAEVMRLPEGGAIVRLHKGPTHVAQLPLMEAEDLFRESLALVEGRTALRAAARALRDGGPLPLLLVAEGRTGRGVLPGGFVLGVWVAEAVEATNNEQTAWTVRRHDDPESVAALRRRYLHQRVDLRDPDALKLRKA